MSNKVFDKYFSKLQYRYNSISITEKADIRVVIPVYLEELYLNDTLESLKKAATVVFSTIEVVLVFNYAQNATSSVKERQERLYNDIGAKKTEYSSFFKLSLIKAFDLPDKHAGAGLARKIGMDYAAMAFINAQDDSGPIVSLDADCRIDVNYFAELLKVFDEGSKGCVIYFEHPNDGLEPGHSEAIMQYELHLRYYLQALRWTGFPYAFHTVGSCFAVSADHYVRAGGMPRKQAGEDFYFLQKLIPMGKFFELTSTTVYPSPRTSNRVPFGTGPSIASLLDANNEYCSYNLQAFVDLKAFFSYKEKLYRIAEDDYDELLNELSGPVRSFLLNSGFFTELAMLYKNCSLIDVFNKRFFELFNAFKVVKYLNYVHEHFFAKVAVFDLAVEFLELNGEVEFYDDTQELLNHFRNMEKG